MTAVSLAFRGLLVVSTAVGVVAVSYTGGLGTAVQDARDFRANAAHIDACHERNGRLDAHGAALSERIHAKSQVATDLMAGRVTLAEAIDLFRALHGDDTGDLLRTGPGATLDEKFARNAIGYAGALAPPDEREAVEARLDVQFRARFGHTH